MRGTQGLPEIHWGFRTQERGAQKEPRLPAGARAFFSYQRSPGIRATSGRRNPRVDCGFAIFRRLGTGNWREVFPRL